MTNIINGAFANDERKRVFGYSADGHYALVLWPDGQYRVHHVSDLNDGRGLRVLDTGRWECSATHLGYYEEVYEKRFPVAP